MYIIIKGDKNTSSVGSQNLFIVIEVTCPPGVVRSL